MAFLGCLQHFDPAEMNLTAWFQLFDEFCTVNNIAEEPAPARAGTAGPNNQRRALFLSYVGPRAYEVLRAASLPGKPNMKSIPTLKQVLKDRYEPEGLRSANRLHFSQRSQRENESIHEFILALQTMAEGCSFGLFLNDALKDRLVAGVRSDQLRRQLLGVVELTWAAAKELALQEEAVSLQARAIANAATVNKISKKPYYKTNHPSEQVSNQPGTSGGNPKIGPCFRCKGSHHADTCKVKDWNCRYCGAVGHIAKACRKRGRDLASRSDDDNQNSVNGDQHRPEAGRVNHVSSQNPQFQPLFVDDEVNNLLDQMQYY